MRLRYGLAILSSCTIVASLTTPCEPEEDLRCRNALWNNCIGCASDNGETAKYCTTGNIPDSEIDAHFIAGLRRRSSQVEDLPPLSAVPLDTVADPTDPLSVSSDQVAALFDPTALDIAPETFGTLDTDLGLTSSPALGDGGKPLLAENDPSNIFTGGPFESAAILDDNFVNNIQFGENDPSEFNIITPTDLGGCVDSQCHSGNVCTPCLSEGYARRYVKCLPAHYCLGKICTCNILTPHDYFNVLKGDWDSPFDYRNP